MTDERIDALIHGLDDRTGAPFAPVEAVPGPVLSRVQAARRQDRSWVGRARRDAGLLTDSDNVRRAFRSRSMLAVAGPLLVGATLIGVIATGSRNTVPGPDRPNSSPLAAAPSATATVSASETPGPTPTTTTETSAVRAAESTGGLLVFSSNGRLIVQRSDGSERRELTDGNVTDYFPVWSPDGTQVAFFSQKCAFGQTCPEKFKGSSLVVIDADGSGRRVLRTKLEDPMYLAWLPDGSGVVETSYGGQSTNITDRVGLDGSVHAARELRPAGWTSPDGTQVLAVSEDGATIRVSNADGSNPRTIAHTSQGHAQLSIVGWSPDGQAIAYNLVTSSYPEVVHTWTVRADGTGAQAWPMPDDGWLVGWPANGRWILVRVPTPGVDGQDRYIVAAADGSNAQRLSTATRGYEWAHGGSWLLGLRGGPIDSPGVAAGIVVVDPSGARDPVDIETPGLLGYDWNPDD